MDDIKLREIATFDQAATASKNMALFLGTYFTHLIGQGFTRDEALRIVLTYQDWLLSQSGQKAEG